MVKSRFLREPLNAYQSVAAIALGRLGEGSEDRSAVVGRNNQCFIYEGSNNYRGAYLDIALAPLGDQWAKVIERRQRACEGIGAHFFQIIVPNKATLMPENFPEYLGGKGITTILERLLASVPMANLICPLELMRQTELRQAIFRRNDSHLTLAGNALLTEMVLAALAIETADVPFIETSEVKHVGDLGGKFHESIAEIYHAPRFNTGLLDQASVNKVLEVQVVGFNGNRQDFNNPTAPIKKSVLVFGNSFFERVPSWGISPLFTALFNDFFFLWTPQFDIDIVKQIRPDIVISQTCERFLSVLPNDNLC